MHLSEAEQAALNDVRALIAERLICVGPAVALFLRDVNRELDRLLTPDDPTPEPPVTPSG